jgi:ABC-type transport system involved in multi-copper enzyme maturation permease subunit
MIMFRYLLRRQLLDDMTSFRFLIYAVLILTCLIAFVLIFSGLHHGRVENFSRNTIENSRSLRSSASSLVSLIWTTQTILLEPQGVRFISDGHEGQMPQGLAVTMLGTRLAAESNDSGIAMLSSPDLTSVVQIVFSFFALVLTFNAVSYEKEKGTLRLVLSNSVLRTKFLLAKYLGAVITVGIPFVIGLLLCLVLLSLRDISIFSGGVITAVLLFLVISLLYLSFFILLGLFCSTAGRGSKSSLVLCLLCWVLVVVILPKSAGPLLHLRTFSVPTGETIAEAARLAGREVWNRHKGESMIAGSPQAESTKLNVRVMNEATQAEERVYDFYLDKKIRGVKTLMAANCVSPASLLEYATSAAAGTGLAHFARFRSQVVQYQNDLIRFFKAQDMQDKESPHLYFHPDYVSKKSFDFSAIPEFGERGPRLLERAKDAAPYGAGLILYNAIMFGLVFITFQRYDVR